MQISLPLSPRKKLCVVQSLAKKVGLSIESSPTSSSSHNSHACNEHTKQLLEAFYNNDDISWQAPGCKDWIIIWQTNNEGKKVRRTEQIRYHSKRLTKNLLRTILMQKLGSVNIVNYYLNVLNYLTIYRISYHENVELLVISLKEHTELSVEFQSFIDQVTCNSSEKTCMSSQCDNCKDKIDNYLPKNPTDTRSYQQWHTNKNVNIIGTVSDAFTEFNKTLGRALDPRTNDAWLSKLT